jgi:hypothetical protein
MKQDQSTTLSLQTEFIQMSDLHLQMRGTDNPDFKKQFIKTFSDLIFSQSDEMLEKLNKTRPASLMNAVFRATEAGASFAKKEISFIPFEIFKKEKVNGADKKTATGEYEALVIFDINFQKQQILKLPNCKKFYTAEVHDGVEIVSDLTTGNFSFDGKNDVTKPTIGYYACFISTDNEIYDLFMTCAEIVERAKFSPQFKAENYKSTGKSIHYEKIVVRNIMKLIPKISNELKSVLAYDENSDFTPYIDVTNEPKNALEEAKKELAEVKPKEEVAPKKQEVATKKEVKTEDKNNINNEVQSFF